MFPRYVNQLLWLVALFALTTGQVMAQDDVGRAVTQDDWAARFPVVLIVIGIVIAVDAYFILPIFRKRNENNGEG